MRSLEYMCSDHVFGSCRVKIHRTPAFLKHVMRGGMAWPLPVIYIDTHDRNLHVKGVTFSCRVVSCTATNQLGVTL